MGGPDPVARTPAPKNLPELDAIDRRILQLLRRNARITNHAVAIELRIAESTAHTRRAALLSRGVIRGYHAEVDLTAVGRPIQALVHVRVQDRSRAGLRDEANRLRAVPGVLDVFFLAGPHDLVVRVACADPPALRDFVVEELNGHAAVASTETSVILEHHLGDGPIIDV